jgi:hypothetical protein
MWGGQPDRYSGATAGAASALPPERSNIQPPMTAIP